MFTKQIQRLFHILIICTWTQLARGTTYQTDKSKCVVKLNEEMVVKQIGDTWHSAKDLCMKHTCVTGPNGIAIESTFQEYCYHTCYNDYELVPKKGQCCGECVKKRCTFQNVTYEIGDMWKSEDQCTFYECAKNQIDDGIVTAQITSYKKSCAAINNCPSNRLTIKDCCYFCQMESKSADNQNHISDFVHTPDKYLAIMSRDTYLQHPCRRECIKGAPPMICNYTFLVEWYETLSKACYDCPFNSSDCYRPHCIYGDGFRRNVLVVNRMMPGPAIEVCKGDSIVADVENNLMGESTSIHWHGLHQRGTPHYDGVVQVTQCPIPTHTTFRYTIKADNPGTHWWHSHVGMQRADGAFGALLIRQPISDLPEYLHNFYDYDLVDHVMIMQDWDRKTGLSSFNSFHHSIGDNKPKNILVNGKGRFFEPILQKNITATTTKTTSIPTTEELTTPNSNVLEGTTIPQKSYSVIGAKQKRSTNNTEPKLETQHTPYEVFNVRDGFRYRFRTINSGFLNCPLEISIDNHTLDVIASDGNYIETVKVDSLVSYAGERFDFVVTANQVPGNYWIRIKGLMDCDERFLKAHQGAILRYNGAPNEDPLSPLTYDYRRGGFQMNSLNRGGGHVDSVSVAELTAAVPDTPELLNEHADYKFYVYYDFYDKDFPHFNHPELYSIQGVTKPSNRFFGPQLNHISMKMPSTPLSIGREQNDESKFCNSSSLSEKNINCRHDFCECSHIIQVPLNATVELVLIDEGYKYDANHPFHLHGHDFRVISMERIQSTGVTVEQIKQLDESGGIRRRLAGAPIKDTVTVPDGGFTIIRFLANNPGFWLLHCHIEFHVEVGMALVFKVGDYHQMPQLPKNFPTCSNFMPQHTDRGDAISENPSSGSDVILSSITLLAVSMSVLCGLALV